MLVQYLRAVYIPSLSGRKFQMLVQYLRAIYIPSLSGRTFQMLVQYLRAVYIYPHYQGGRSKC